MVTVDPKPSDGGLVGRDRELAACEELFGRASREGSALLLRGSAGIGKTSLLDAARARAEALGFRVLGTAGSEAEGAFAFAALQPLLLPVIDIDAGLPEHLRTALLSALGLVDAEVPALETVGLAVLGLLAGLATEATPLCVVVDDMHWLDTSTAAVLHFVVRRLSADPIILLAAGRDGGWPPAGMLPEMRIEPLTQDAAEALLDARAPALPLPARRRVLAEAAGNPLGLVELSGSVAAAQRDRTRALPEVLPLSARLEAAFAGRAGSMSGATRAALLVAALAPAAVTAEVLAAASALTGTPVELSALDAAADEGLVNVVGRQVQFRHPLMRSGVVAAAAPSSLRAAHQALARVLHDQERRLYHRAEATVGYDDELAGELEAAAELAVRRGALASAVRSLDQAAALTVPAPLRGGRLVRAAQLSFELGQADATRRFLALADSHELAWTEQTAARRLAVAIDGPDTDDPRRAWELLAFAEESLAAGDRSGALDLLVFTSSQLAWGKPWLEVGRAIIAAVQRVPAAEDDLRVIAVIAQAQPVLAHRELTARLEKLDDERLTDAASQQLIGFACVITADYERGGRLLGRAEQQLRKDARLAQLGLVLTFRGIAAFSAGQWRLAEQVLDEAERLTVDTVQPSWLHRARYTRAGVAGLSGDEERYRQIIDELAATFQRTGASHRDNHLTFMQGITATMAGRHDDALALLGALFEPDDPMFEARTGYDALFYLADSAVAKDRADLVKRALDVMAATVPAPWPAPLQAAADYARAVTADETMAGPRLEAALAGPAGDRVFDRARVQLAYGRWLRHHYQQLKAREHLREARDIFDRLGNDPFANRSRDELRAAGEASHKRRSAAWDQLSPQELQIAHLVAEGLSNKQIGERLFLSHRTIASHLYRIFPKLGVTSRAQLAAALRSA
jgi:DNA-binding CsgD family transcriptional regulator